MLHNHTPLIDLPNLYVMQMQEEPDAVEALAHQSRLEDGDKDTWNTHWPPPSKETTVRGERRGVVNKRTTGAESDRGDDQSGAANMSTSRGGIRRGSAGQTVGGRHHWSLEQAEAVEEDRVMALARKQVLFAFLNGLSS